MMMGIPMGIGLWLSALAIRYRDVKFVMQFAMRMLMYSAPIVYSAATIPEVYRIFYSLNPIVGVIEGFRSCLLNLPFQWEFIVPGIISTILLIASDFGLRWHGVCITVRGPWDQGLRLPSRFLLVGSNHSTFPCSSYDDGAIGWAVAFLEYGFKATESRRTSGVC